MKNKTLLISGIVVSSFVLAVAGLAGYDAIFADENLVYPPIIQKLVEKFGLDPAEVREVFTAEREERAIQREQNFQERLEEGLQNAADNGIDDGWGVGLGMFGPGRRHGMKRGIGGNFGLGPCPNSEE
ncbi:MAG: hypothetical protein COT37_00315 [Parcubacteria group bacterium CG08_land_8_20_14_0_20_43_9]|nr:MAG: hypothetical protein COT37_00315 [Parcubacteria group bacterium CG08_land_8_20_14_0_20_43_9]